MLIIGGVHKNPGPVSRQNDQLQMITQNVRGMIEFKKKKLILNKCNEIFKENPSTIIFFGYVPLLESVYKSIF